MNDSYESRVDEVRRRAESSLSLHGWTVDVQPSESPWIQLRIEHPLSSQFLLTLDDRQDALAGLDRHLRAREFSVIAEAPNVGGNAPLMRLLRQRASAFQWPDSVLGEVADVLESQGLLTHDETVWLARAGQAWQK